MNQYNIQDTNPYGYNNYTQQNKPPQKSNVPLIVIIILSALVSILAIAAVIMFSLNNKTANSPVLNIINCPEQISSTNPTVTITGTIYDEKYPCVLTINGETITTAMIAGQVTNWSKTYTLNSGETKTLNFTLKNDRDQVTNESRTIYCQVLETVVTPSPEPVINGPLKAGCSFVKKKKDGLNIREYAGTEYEIVDVIGGNDYSSTMIFTGYTAVDYEGYTWYEVIAPNGMNGYVRSDLVKRIN